MVPPTVASSKITPLPDGYRDVFELAMTIPADAAGTTLYFPTIQTCEQAETPWIDIPSAGQSEDDLEHPAPSVAVVAPGPAATADHHD